MRVITTVDELLEVRGAWERPVGLVPTMGYLHAGHLSLAQLARAENATAVASIFVNPTQFAPSEDLARYPRDLPRDLALLESAGIDIVFAPADPSEIYPPDFNTYVEPTGSLATRLEAATRPGHFRGVATVVLKLFNLIQPDHAYFGQKDAQQVAIIRRLIADFNLPVTLRVGSIVREADGLAMSSRNSYLGPADRAAAPTLFRALQAGMAAFNAQRDAQRDADSARVRHAMVEAIETEPRIILDYAEVCHPHTFQPLDTLTAPALLAVAARVGPARLIDNIALREDGSWDMGNRVS